MAVILKYIGNIKAVGGGHSEARTRDQMIKSQVTSCAYNLALITAYTTIFIPLYCSLLICKALNNRDSHKLNSKRIWGGL